MMPDATPSPGTDPLVRFYAGRDIMQGSAWHAVLQFLPMRSLMTRRSDEGRIALAALEIEVGIRRSLSRLMNDSREVFWMPYIRIRSDAGEIAERRAAHV